MKLILTLEEYLGSRSIKYGSKNRRSLDKLTMEDVINQIYLIEEVQMLIKGGSREPYLKLMSTVGKDEEEFKILLKKFVNVVNYIKDNGVKNDFEKVLVNISDEVVRKSNNALEGIFSKGYEEIISRSMKEKEVIIYYCDNSNLYRDNNVIRLYKNKGIAYNFKEIDYARYLVKLKNKVEEGCFNEFVDTCSEICEFDLISKNYIESYVKFPQEILKSCIKYKSINEEDKSYSYLEKLKESNFYKELV